MSSSKLSEKKLSKKKPVSKVVVENVVLSTDKMDLTYLKKFGILVGVLTGIFIIIAGVTLASRRSWVKGLAINVDSVLNDSYGEFTVEENIPVLSGFNVSGAIYKVAKASSAYDYYAMILRVQTMYGPLPGVFLYEPGKDYSTFMGFTTVTGSVANQIYDVSKNSQIEFWEMKVPEIIDASLKKEGE